MTDQRIKLAEFVGWTWDAGIRPENFADRAWPCWIKPNGDKWYGPEHMPDPRNSADDDYAVLEKMRDEFGRWRIREALKMGGDWPYTAEKSENYQIGDYARAALKIIEQQEDDDDHDF